MSVTNGLFVVKFYEGQGFTNDDRREWYREQGGIVRAINIYRLSVRHVERSRSTYMQADTC